MQSYFILSKTQMYAITIIVGNVKGVFKDPRVYLKKRCFKIMTTFCFSRNIDTDSIVRIVLRRNHA